MIKIRKTNVKDIPVLAELWKEFEDEHIRMLKRL